MGTVESGPELAADALGQLGGTEALDGLLGHLPLPFQCDGGWAHPCDALDDLWDEESQLTQGCGQEPPEGANALPLWATHSLGAG